MHPIVPRFSPTPPAATQVMAHRGASRAERENTLAAFHRAATMGAHAVELDVRLSLDGHMVVHHNPTVADGRVIVQTPAGELPELIPHLDAALNACAGMWVNIEIKNDESEPDYDPDDRITARVAEYLAARGEHDRWLISSFRRETVDAMHRLLPGVATAWLTSIVDDAGLEPLADDLKSAGHTALHPWVGGVTKRMIDVFHSRGLAVNTWTCDDSDRMRELISWGVDGICTNVPDVALGVCAGS